MKDTVVVNTFANGFTGYGIKIYEIVRGLVKKGFKVKFRVLFAHEAFDCPIPDDIKALFVHQEQPEPFELVFYPPRYKSEFPGQSTRKQVLYTMWETTRLPKEFTNNCNKHVALIVPTKWNKDVFQSSGVKVPVYVSPLGIDMTSYVPNPRRFPSECVFITAGRVAHGYARKGIDFAMDIFKKAFPNESDVKLRVKCFPDCNTAANFDSRISIIKANMSQESLVEFYQDSIAYIDATKAEGFGLHQLEANACGKIVLGAAFSGKPIFEMANENIRVKHSLANVEVEDPYRKIGKWAKLDEKDFIQALRFVYQNQNKVWLAGQSVRSSIEHYNIENMVDSLIDNLAKIGVI